MSQSQIATATRRDDASEDTMTVTEGIQDVLDALDDSECRAILEATTGDSMTAAEIADECSLPSSTAYRKIDRLADADLLAEALRIRRSGKHVSEYTCAVDDVTLSVGEGGVELAVSHTDAATGTDHPNPLAD